MKRTPTAAAYYRVEAQPKPVKNPYIGFTTFQHFEGDPLYSDITVDPRNNGLETEERECYPVPAYIEHKGNEQGFYPPTTIAYIRILWKDFEPQRGQFNYALIADTLDRARAAGQTVMFRLLPHSTRASDDVPDWLKALTPCPERPDGKRVKDSPADPVYLRYFGEAIRALAARFDGDPVLDLIDVSITGAWGEGHGCDNYPREALQELMDVYTSSFHHTQLIGQVAAPWLVDYGCRTVPVGWRADGIGQEYLTYEFYPQINAQLSDCWKTAPVVFESYWWLCEWLRQGWDIDDIIEHTLRWHISNFNAKSMPVPFAWREKIDYWLSRMGYHFALRALRYPQEACPGDELELRLFMENRGVAPIYRRIPVVFRLTGNGHSYCFDTPIDIRRWMPGESQETVSLALPADMAPGDYTLEMAITGDGLPTVQTEMLAERDGAYARLATLTVHG